MAMRIAWRANPGPQEWYLSCPAFELLGWGNRGGGKSDALLFSFAQHVGRGHKQAWRGVIFRREYKDLTDLVERSKKWFGRIFPGAKFHQSASDYYWQFPDGERLYFRHAKREDDLGEFLGQEWPFIGWDELPQWPNDKLYTAVMGSCRSSDPDVPRMIRCTGNPWGAGAAWVKARYVDPAPAGVIQRERVEVDGLDGGKVTVEITRTHLKMMFADNPELIKADPAYQARLQPSDMAKRKAWIDGDWSTAIGGFFYGIHDPDTHVIEAFRPPMSWRIDRSHDWGWSSPHATIWWAESDGTPAQIAPGIEYAFPKGTLFAIHELYGTAGNVSDWNIGRRDTDAKIAEDIRSIDKALARRWGLNVRPGPADTQIFQGAGKRSIHDSYKAEGVRFTEADKRPGSRVTGSKAIADRLVASRPYEAGRPMERPGLFIFGEECPHLARNMGEVQRSDKDPDAYDTEGEDHLIDTMRYRVSSTSSAMTQQEI
jgi:hypothetical protein